MNTQECIIGDKKYTITEFIENNELIDEYKNELIKLFNNEGNELIFCNGKKIKPYFRKLISNTNAMTEWHRKFQEYFSDCIEKTYYHEDMCKKYRRADVDLNELKIIEFQHSYISIEEVISRKNDYEKINKEIIWVIDCNKYNEKDTILITNLDIHNRIIIEFQEEFCWKYKNFVNYERIYLSIEDKIYYINPSMVRSRMIDVAKPIYKYEFCEKLKKNEKIFEDEIIIQSTIYISQQGAGNGKTFRATNLLSEDYNDHGKKYHHYDTFLYLTKQHSAKTVIYNEFIFDEKLKSNHLSKYFDLISTQKKTKKYIIILQHKETNKIYKIIIATVDSLIYSLCKYKSSTIGIEKFKAMAQSILDEGINFKCNESGITEYNKNLCLNKKLLIIGDEMQDLDETIAQVILKICAEKYVDFYMVGDTLQSITHEINAFTYINSKINSSSTLKVIKYIPENKVMRFGNSKLIDFINSVIPFEKYELPKIEKHEKCSDDDSESVLNIFYYDKYNECKESEADYLNNQIDIIMEKYIYEVMNNDYKPNDFLIVTPTTKNNYMIESLNLAIREFWTNIYKSDKYEDNIYSVFHKSEDGCSIDLDESVNSTRIVSIHTSKGDGRNVVFLIGIDEKSLRKFSNQSNNLVYNSLLHVSLTRMKKKLYFRIEKNGDDIYNKIENICKYYPPSINYKDKINLYTLINIDKEENYKSLYESFIKNTKYANICFEETRDTIILDFKHHTIRRVVMNMLFLITLMHNIINNNYLSDQQQIRKILETNFRNKSSLIECTNWRDYNKILYLKKEINSKTKIPLLINNKTICTIFHDIIHDNIKKIDTFFEKKIYNESKINRCKSLKFNIIESICLYHTIEIETKTKAYKSLLPVTDLYDIINLFNSKTLDEKAKYESDHYEQLSIIEKIYPLINTKYLGLKWLFNKSFYYKKQKNSKTKKTSKNVSINIMNTYNYIAYNDSVFLICKLYPQFTQLNYDDIINESIFDIFFIQNRDFNNDEKYFITKTGEFKKIIVCIITLDLTEPYYIDIDDKVKEHKENIKKLLKHKLTSLYRYVHDELYNFYIYYYNEYRKIEIIKPNEIIDKINFEFKKRYNQYKDHYIYETFKYIKDRVAEKEDDSISDQLKILEDYCINKIFIKRLNVVLNQKLKKIF